ncbi:hypothetical protein V8F06_009197 [Rhypophila decipiens]
MMETPSPLPTGAPPLQKRIVASVLGPLTTTWTQPKDCTYLLQPLSTLTNFFRNQGCIIRTPDAIDPNATGIPEDRASCWPPTTSNAPTPTPPFFGWGIYSPAYICPQGYVTACSAEYGRRSKAGGWSTAKMQFDIEPGETVFGCCPESYTCADYNGVGTCTLVAGPTLTGSERITVPTARCEGTDMVGTETMATLPSDVIDVGSWAIVPGRPETPTRVIAVVDVLPTLSTSLTRGVTLYAPLFHLYFQETDLPDGGLGPLNFPTGNTGDRSMVPTQSSESGRGDNKPSTGGGGGGLSTGATAGIAVGVVIAVVLLLGLGFCLIMRRRKRRSKAGGADGNGLWSTKSELPGHGVSNKTPGAVSSYPYTGGSISSPADSHGHHQNLYMPAPPTELAANGEGVTPVEMYVPGMEEKPTTAPHHD